MRDVIGYMSGPADGLDIVQSWKSGGRTEFFGTVYMSQFCSVVRELGASGVIITYRPAPSSCDVIDEFSIYNIERKERRGLSYHVDNIGRLLKSYAILRRHGASSVVLTEGANYWFTALVLRISKIRIIPSIHCTLWRPFQRERLPIRILHRLNRHLFFRWQRGPIMGVSQEIGRQVRAWAKQAPFYRFIPTYSESDFSHVPPPRPKSSFTILSAGRVEADKGHVRSDRRGDDSRQSEYSRESGRLRRGDGCRTAKAGRRSTRAERSSLCPWRMCAPRTRKVVWTL